MVKIIRVDKLFRKLESPQVLKLLPASTDDSTKKNILGVSGSRILFIVWLCLLILPVSSFFPLHYLFSFVIYLFFVFSFYLINHQRTKQGKSFVKEQGLLSVFTLKVFSIVPFGSFFLQPSSILSY